MIAFQIWLIVDDAVIDLVGARIDIAPIGKVADPGWIRRKLCNVDAMCNARRSRTPIEYVLRSA
jgi:hypothetical protein